MITFIVCSIRKEQLAGLAASLAATAGVEYELLVHDNRETHWGLGRVYNHLAERARFPLLCFVHEDVRFLSPPGWGRALVDFYAAHARAGVVGFAGSQVKSRAASGWGNLARYNRENFVQHLGGGKARTKRHNPQGETFSRVSVVDGLCLFAPLEVWRTHRFDEVAFPGFHLYDLDFCTQVALTHTNHVCHTVLAEHLSLGSFGEEWCDATDSYHRKWAAQLPLACLPLSAAELRQCEAYSAYRHLRDRLKAPAVASDRLEQAWRAYRPYATPLRDLKLLRLRLLADRRRARSPAR
jgi:hypothetical protein